MNILQELNALLSDFNIQSGYSNEHPNEYIVFVPLNDTFPLMADNLPQLEKQECRITLFTKGNYIKLKNKITTLLLNGDFNITLRKYNGYDSGYFGYTIDVEKLYQMEV